MINRLEELRRKMFNVRMEHRDNYSKMVDDLRKERDFLITIECKRFMDEVSKLLSVGSKLYHGRRPDNNTSSAYCVEYTIMKIVVDYENLKLDLELKSENGGIEYRIFEIKVDSFKYYNVSKEEIMKTIENYNYTVASAC